MCIFSLKIVKSLAEKNLCLVHITALQEAWTYTHQWTYFFAGLSKVLPAWIPCLTPLPIKDDAHQDTFFRRFLSIHTENTMEAWSQLVLSPLIMWSGSTEFGRHFIHTLYSGPRNSWLWEGKQFFHSPCAWITGLGRQPPYLQEVGAGNVVGCVQAFSSLYSAQNISGERLSTFWKYWPSGTRTQEEKAQIQHSAGNVLSIK